MKSSERLGEGHEAPRSARCSAALPYERVARHGAPVEVEIVGVLYGWQGPDEAGAEELSCGSGFWGGQRPSLAHYRHGDASHEEGARPRRALM